MTLRFIPMAIAFFIGIRRHYHAVKLLTASKAPVRADTLKQEPIVVVPVDYWNDVTRLGIELAARLSSEVAAVHIEAPEHSELLQADWKQYVEQPFSAAGKQPPRLEILQSPYRFVIVPIVQFILDLSKNQRRPHHHRSDTRTGGGQMVRILPPQSSARGSFQWMLLARGNDCIFTVSAPWYVQAKHADKNR